MVCCLYHGTTKEAFLEQLEYIYLLAGREGFYITSIEITNEHQLKTLGINSGDDVRLKYGDIKIFLNSNK